MDSRGRSLAALLAAVVGGIAVLLVQWADVRSRSAIEIDMQIGAGELAELYLNDPATAEPLRLPVIPNQRRSYRFDRPPHRIRLMRLDPTAAPQTRVVIFGARVATGDRVVREFSAAELGRWRLSEVTVADAGSTALTLNTTGSDPQLSAEVALDLPPPNRFIAQAGAALASGDSMVLIAMGAFLLLALAGSVRRDGLREMTLVAVLIATAHPLLTRVLPIAGGPPPVHGAVGMAAYMGYPKSGDYIKSYCLLAFCAILAVVCWRWLSPRDEVDPEQSAAGSTKRWHTAGHALVMLVLVLYYLPDLRGGLAGLKESTYAPFLWDDANGFIWSYLVQSGYRPFRDFWYPYAGYYLQFLPFPGGALIGAVFMVLPLWFLYLGLYYVLGRRLRQTVCAFAVVLAPVWMGQLQTSSRYLLAADVALLYLAAARSKRFEWGVHPGLGACAAFAMLCEPTQIAYAGIAIGVELALVLAAHGREALMLLKQRARLAGIPMAVGFILSLGFFATQGMLPGLWSFQTSLREQAAYGAFPAKVEDWVRPIFTPDCIFLVLFLLAACAIYRWLLRRRRPDPMTTALLMMCAIGALCMQKQIMRPHSMSQIRVYPYLAIVLYAVTMWRERPRVAKPLIAMAAAAIVMVSWSSALIPNVWRRLILQAGPMLAADIDLLLNHRAEMREVSATRFDTRRFTAFKEQNAAVDIIRKSGIAGPVYVLGDDSLFYILLGQQPPYVVNCYNMSPVYEQERTVQWLERVRPAFVIWSPESAAFDNTPHVVRLPLVFEYVVRHYGFAAAAGRYHILSPLPAGHAPDVSYWRRTLGLGEDLGAIPSIARASDFGPCTSEPCQALIVIQPGESRPTAGKASVPIRAPAGEFVVDFNLTPNAAEYVIPVDRLWFSPWLDQQSLQFGLLDTRLQVSVERRARSNAVLY